MFYHFKGTITGEDYQRILGQMTKRMMLVFSGIMLIFLVINLFMSKGQWLWPVVSALLVLVLGNLFLHWQLKSRFLKNFKPQELDMYVTEEQIKDRVHFFQGRNQVMIFKKDMLQDLTQWDSFVNMAKNLPLQTKK